MPIDLAMALVRGQYQVPARRGRRVTLNYPEGTSRDGVIVAAEDGMVVVDFGGARAWLHPDWHLTYHLEPGEVWS
jgi:DnaJ-class molecular chaperone